MQKNQRNPLSLAISTAILSASLPAAANNIEISATYNDYEPGGVSETESSSGTGSQSVDLGYHYSSGANSTYLRASASADETSYGLRAGGGRGTFDSEAAVTISSQIENSSGSDQRVSMDFTVDRGSLFTQTLGYATNDSWVQSEYSATIQANENQVWGSGAALRHYDNGAPASLSKSGVDLAGSFTNYENDRDSTYSWGAQAFTVDLGVLRAGESMELEYFARVFSSGFTRYENGYDYGGGASGSFGDPFEFTGIPLFSEDSFNFETVTSVPEPGTGALIGAGLLALGWKRRQQRRQAGV